MKKTLLIFSLTFLLSLLASAVCTGAVKDTEQEIIDAVNELREKYNCNSLLVDEHLMDAARRQAEYLAEIGKLDTLGPYGESARQRVLDAGYGGEKDFTVEETTAKVWVDTDTNYLIERIWRVNRSSLQAIFSADVRQVGIGIADADDLHRYIVLILAGLDDGTDDYSPLPTYDYRTPKPTSSATPTPEQLQISTPNPDGGVYHVVQPGETFSEIAMAYGLDWYTLLSRNYMKMPPTGTPIVIYEGQKLIIEPTYTATLTPTATRTPIPSTSTPRPTFTPGVVILPTGQARDGGSHLPMPDWRAFTDKLVRHKAQVGLVLVGISLPCLVITLKKRK